MEYTKRGISDRLKLAFKSFPVVVLVGARQVGKSTLLSHLFSQEAKGVVFDPLQDVGNARAEPDLFIRTNPTPLILDEIQYAPEVVPAIKRAVDRDRSPGQYLITGSQQWEVMKSLSESLAGRALILELDGFSLVELYGDAQEGATSWLQAWIASPGSPQGFKQLKERYSVYEQLWRGWLPDAQTLDMRLIPDFHESYLRTYIERDARLLANISDWRQFRRFYQLCNALTAQETNYSELGRDIGLSQHTAKHWLEILIASFQWHEIPAFSQNTVKRISKKPKGHSADTGLVCTSNLISSPDALAGHPRWGNIFESAVVAEIRKSCALMTTSPRLYHWRSHGGAEVDIVLEIDNTFFPIEVKSTTHPSKGDARGILAFKDTYPNLNTAPGIIICLAERVQQIHDSVFVIPWNSTV